MMDHVYYWVGVAVVWGNITVLAILLGLNLLGNRWYVYRWRLGKYWRRNDQPEPSASLPEQPLNYQWRRRDRRSRQVPPARSEGA